MKKRFSSGIGSVFIITCDNLGEYFAEFAKYRKAVGESGDWDKGFKNFYGENVRTFMEDYGTDFIYRKNSRIFEILYKDYNNDLEGRDGKIELELVVDLKSPEWLSQREKVNQTLKEIWKTGEFKNSYGLDLNWPVASQPDQNRLPDNLPKNTDKQKIKELEKEISELKEQLKKETNNKTIWMVISIAVVSVFVLILFFGWLKIKKLKKR